MPTYRLINPSTKEVEDHLVSIADYEVLKQEGYVQVFEPSKIIRGKDHSGTAGGHGTSNEWKDKLREIKKHHPLSTIDV
tara:strand:+ start:1760 stop:1996 length:237 start_codon:yes stop_codon:yes gene_type:complete